MGVTLAFRNIPGVDTICVDKLNLLRLAPGGRVGRFCIWSEGAFKMLDALYGTYHEKSELKKDYNLPKPIMTSADFMQVIKDENIRRHLKAPQFHRQFSNIKLNPYAAVEKDLARARQVEGIKNKQLKIKRLAMKESLAKRKLNSEIANKAAKRRAAKLKELKRHQKAYKVMKKFEAKTRKPRKLPEDKTIQSKEEKIAFRKEKVEEYRQKAKARKAAVKK